MCGIIATVKIESIYIKNEVKRIYINKVAILIHQRIFILSVNNRIRTNLSTKQFNIYNVWLIINDYRNN